MPPPRPIRFCTQNPRTSAERQALLDAGCVMRDCLSNCSRCFHTRFLCVGDDPIEGDDYETILVEARRLAATDERTEKGPAGAEPSSQQP